MSLYSQSFKLIAETDDTFADFAPYVASINDAGLAAFQAALRDGHTGIFIASDGKLTRLLHSSEGSFDHFNSHPDINNAGAISCYTGPPEGDAHHEGMISAAYLHEGSPIVLAGSDTIYPKIGPLGPTMNDAHTVAFRATDRRGHHCVVTGHPDGSIARIADTNEAYSGFQGLPVINEQGSVLYRADRKDGGQGIYVHRPDGELIVIAETGTEFRSLARFPMLNNADDVAFAAELRDGTSGVFVSKRGETPGQRLSSKARFASIRGALIDDRDRIVYFATPHDGQLGIYREGVEEPLLAFGQQLFGSIVNGFAANPVSLNGRGDLVIRVALADGTQKMIVAGS